MYMISDNECGQRQQSEAGGILRLFSLSHFTNYQL
jgi:hypothetical protein